MNYSFRYLIFLFVFLGGYFNAYSQKGLNDSLVYIIKNNVEKISSGVYAVGDKGEDLINIPSKSIIVSLDISSDKKDTSLLIDSYKLPIKKIRNVFKIQRDDNLKDFNKSLTTAFPNSTITDATLLVQIGEDNFNDILEKASLKRATSKYLPSESLSSLLLNCIIDNCKEGNKLGIIDGKFYPILPIDKSEAMVIGKYSRNALVTRSNSSLPWWFFMFIGAGFGLLVYAILNYIQNAKRPPINLNNNDDFTQILKKVKDNNQKTDLVELIRALGLDPVKIETHFFKEKEVSVHFNSLLDFVEIEERKNNRKFRDEYDQLTEFEHNIKDACTGNKSDPSKTLKIIDTKFGTDYGSSLEKLKKDSTNYDKLNSDNKNILDREKAMSEKIKHCADGDFAKIRAFLQDLKIPIKNIKENKPSKTEPVETELDAYFRGADTRFGSFLYDFKSKNIDKQEDKKWFVTMLVELSLHYVDLIESQSKDFSAAEKKFTDANIKLIANRVEKKDLGVHQIDDIEIKPWVIKLVDFLKNIGIEKLENTFVRGYEIQPDYLKPESGQPKNMVRYFAE